MKLRARQKHFVERSLLALNEHGNTLGIAPTGAGKTVMMSAIVAGGKNHVDKKFYGDWDGPVLVLQHRDELVTQNRKTFELIAPDMRASIVNAQIKDMTGDAMFAMVQTLVNRLDDIPELSVLAIDEAHHAVAPSYRKIIDAVARRSPYAKIIGVTATPDRGDSHGLRSVFSNVSDKITITELVKAGHLVRPRCYAIDIGVAGEVQGARKTKSGEYDPDAVAAIMDKKPLNDRVIDEWEKAARDRQTVVFCATVAHAEHLAELWCQRGYKAAHIDGAMNDFKRKSILEAYDRGDIQIIVNVMVLTEGWDNQPTSCVVLTRPCSFKSLMIQMIGRGLRKVDPARYPGRRKDDCVVLDFGATLMTHGDLETDVAIDNDEIQQCPSCDATIPANSRECALCGADLRPELPDEEKPKSVLRALTEKEEVSDFVMTEIELLDASPFRWEDFYDGLATVCSGIDAWAAVVQYKGRWYAFGGTKDGTRLLADSDDYVVTLATADDYMRDNSTDKKSKKTQSWMRQKATAKQAMVLLKLGYQQHEILSMSCYRAACAMTWSFNYKTIRARLMALEDQRAA